MKITVTSLTKPGEFTKWATEVVTRDAERVVRRLAEMCEISIKENILNTSKMPTGALADAFFKEQISSLSWGVGNIAYLNQNAKHWRHINFGSQAIDADWPHWLPKGHWDNGRWIEGNEDTDYFDIPKTPIQAHNYIEKTLMDMEIAIQRVLSERK